MFLLCGGSSEKYLNIRVRTCVMATKSITIKESAYELLKSKKKEGESFSDVIEKLGKRKSLTELANTVSKEKGRKIADRIEENRKEIEKDLEERQKEIKEALK